MLVLASTSNYRRALLERLRIDFVTEAPGVDEAQLDSESPIQLVARLSAAKARAVGARHESGLFIGSDQVAVLDDSVVGKPGDFEANVRQLRASAGRWIQFLTGVCLYNRGRERQQLHVERFDVKLRRLEPSEVSAYVERERAFDCAGGFRAESLGCAIFEKTRGDDPTALQGLPMVRLCAMLHAEAHDVLGTR